MFVELLESPLGEFSNDNNRLIFAFTFCEKQRSCGKEMENFWMQKNGETAAENDDLGCVISTTEQNSLKHKKVASLKIFRQKRHAPQQNLILLQQFVPRGPVVI